LKTRGCNVKTERNGIVIYASIIKAFINTLEIGRNVNNWLAC